MKPEGALKHALDSLNEHGRWLYEVSETRAEIERNAAGESRAEVARRLEHLDQLTADRTKKALADARTAITRDVDPEINYGSLHYTSRDPADLAIQTQATAALQANLAADVPPAEAAAAVIESYGIHGWRAARAYLPATLPAQGWEPAQLRALGLALDDMGGRTPGAPAPLAGALRWSRQREAVNAAITRFEEAFSAPAGSEAKLSAGIAAEGAYEVLGVDPPKAEPREPDPRQTGPLVAGQWQAAPADGPPRHTGPVRVVGRRASR